ncbi:MAG: flagellar basal body-associated FliL family protein [Planctomycetaceae bacterium]
MAEAPAGENKSDGGKGAGGGKLGWVITAVVAGGIGAAVPYVLPANLQPGHAASAPSEHEDEQPASPAEVTKPAYIEFGEIVVNLESGRLPRYIKLKIALQVKEKEKEEINAAMLAQEAVLRNWLISYLSDQPVDGVQGRIGQNRLRREIRDEFNTVLFPDGYDRIDEILFQEFAIQ